MSLLDPITRLIEDPPPSYAFEISEAGIAFAHATDTAFRPFEEGVLAVSPSRDNVQKPESFASHVAALVPAANRGKRRPAALILPDYAARVQVLDFDQFPSAADEQLALIKFRVKKTVPFDVDAAVVSYHVQASGKRVDVVAAIMALEIVARYEAPFRAVGFHPGLITTSSLASLNLAPSEGVTVVVKLTGGVLNVMVQDGAQLKLARCVALEAADVDEILAVLYPTLAFVEDELNARPDRILFLGQASDFESLSHELNLPVEPARSRYGTPGEFNAGLLGYMQGAVQ
jgi:type IV pilus assembly protein PilM